MTDYATAADTELLSACRAGDQSAWNALVTRYQALVYTIPRRYRLTDAEVEDVFQSVWLRLIENLHRIDQPERLSAWLVTTAKRETWDRRRGAAYERVDTVDPFAFESLPRIDPMQPDEIVAQYEAQQQLRQALQSLDERCARLLFLLYYAYPRPSYREIADRLELAIGSIGPIRARCLERLSRLIEDEF
ncbi:MAG: sigma-70 family RNA polymerase sigma factor [Anaerolineales bacterium]|nr:sigma-70 family RNA polymerase sigma factor [Anaerolineales bacterium]MCB9126708.1 sigma-70 family RNA polymerase sigma factor [Ardenticatenales bacterium]MCB9171750.1 sigma-70 family RNA polymerase sigma factor [Ardenticatenales bacterium]